MEKHPDSARVSDEAAHNGVAVVRVTVIAYGAGTGGLAPKNDTVYIATKSSNVVACPLNGETLVEEAGIQGTARETGKPEEIDAVVDDDNEV